MYRESGGLILTWTVRQRDHREDTVAGCRVKRRKHCEKEMRKKREEEEQ